MSKLIIERFNGREIFRIGESRLRIMRKNGFLETLIEVKTDKSLKKLPDTSRLGATPSAEIMFKVEGEDMKVFDNLNITIPSGFSDVLKEYITTFCYSGHIMMNDNELSLSTSRNKHSIEWTSKIMDVNYYDGSVHDAKVIIKSELIIEESSWTCIDDLKLIDVTRKI